VKHLRLAKISTMEAANEYLENEYWPEWNEHFASPVADFANHHRLLTPQLNLDAILSHVEERLIGNDYTFSFVGHRYQIQRADVQAGMRRQRLRVELRLDYLAIQECGARVEANPPKTSKTVRKDHNAGDRSNWMDALFNRPSPLLWKLIED
jgi:hypothetical protein